MHGVDGCHVIPSLCFNNALNSKIDTIRLFHETNQFNPSAVSFSMTVIFELYRTIWAKPITYRGAQLGWKSVVRFKRRLVFSMLYDESLPILQFVRQN